MREQAGIAGKLHTQLVLFADGTMSYTEQLKRAKVPPQILSETGCWRRDGQTLVLQTLESNGVPVESDDPIYRNQYRITSESGTQLTLTGSNGVITARRMADSYKLPVF